MTNKYKFNEFSITTIINDSIFNSGVFSYLGFQ